MVVQKFTVFVVDIVLCGLYVFVGVVLDGCASWEEFADETVLVLVASSL